MNSKEQRDNIVACVAAYLSDCGLLPVPNVSVVPRIEVRTFEDGAMLSVRFEAKQLPARIDAPRPAGVL